MKKKHIALHWQILIGMAVGVLFALILSYFSWGPGFIKAWIKPIGTIFINSLKLIAVPLILASIIKGISDLGDLSKLSKMGSKTILSFILTTFVAVSLGLLCVNIIKPGIAISEETRTNLLKGYADEITNRIELAEQQKKAGPLQAIEDIVPSNIFLAVGDNTKMLQVIFFAVFFGISLILAPPNIAKPVRDFFLASMKSF